MDDLSAIYTPGQAARRLGVSTQSLRRYAEDYAEVFEPVPQRNKQREFNDLIVGRLRAAQELQQQGVAPSMKAALERVRDGNPEAEELNTLTLSPFEEAVLQRLEVLIESNRVLHDRVRELERGRHEEGEQLLQRVEVAARQLETAQGGDVAGAGHEFTALRHEVRNTRWVVEAQSRGSGREAELEQINGYLLKELQRRRLEAESESTRRPWWQFWGRS